MSNLTPEEIVKELNRFIVGHDKAKTALAIALRNRWRRMQLDPTLREEILPKNILMIGSTGIGKTELARRLAKMANAPFLKVEATKFTEIGYVGRDVEQIIRDLIEISIQQTRKNLRSKSDNAVKDRAIQKVINLLKVQYSLKESDIAIRQKLIDGAYDEFVLELSTNDHYFSGIDYSNSSMIQFGEWLSKTFNERSATERMNVKRVLEYFIEQEADKNIDQDIVIKNAIENLEQNGIVFIDEIDKISGSSNAKQTTDVSREGVQRDLLPLIEGTTVMTKYGNIKTDHILFIAAGAFYMAKPSELLPELQGRFPIRVEMQPLTRDDFVSILTLTENNLLKQAGALLKTEGVEIEFTQDAIAYVAKLAVDSNRIYENIGARRLYTILESILEEISYKAPNIAQKKQVIDVAYIQERVDRHLVGNDLKKFMI